MRITHRRPRVPFGTCISSTAPTRTRCPRSPAIEPAGIGKAVGSEVRSGEGRRRPDYLPSAPSAARRTNSAFRAPCRCCRRRLRPARRPARSPPRIHASNGSPVGQMLNLSALFGDDAPSTNMRASPDRPRHAALDRAPSSAARWPSMREQSSSACGGKGGRHCCRRLRRRLELTINAREDCAGAEHHRTRPVPEKRALAVKLGATDVVDARSPTMP